MVLAKYNDEPLTEKASTMAAGINNIIVLSCSTKIFLTAGSKSHAIAAVPPATQIDKKSAIINDDSIRILIIQIRTGGIGLNLQSYNNVIITNPDWNPCNEIQAYARAHRIGQTRIVKIWRLISTSNKTMTPDQYIINKQMHKRQIMATVLNDDEFINDTFMYKSSISFEEMKELVI